MTLKACTEPYKIENGVPHYYMMWICDKCGTENDQWGKYEDRCTHCGHPYIDAELLLGLISMEAAAFAGISLERAARAMLQRKELGATPCPGTPGDSFRPGTHSPRERNYRIDRTTGSNWNGEPFKHWCCVYCDLEEPIPE